VTDACCAGANDCGAEKWGDAIAWLEGLAGAPAAGSGPCVGGVDGLNTIVFTSLGGAFDVLSS
jgi:hypothetical protein